MWLLQAESDLALHVVRACAGSISLKVPTSTPVLAKPGKNLRFALIRVTRW